MIFTFLGEFLHSLGCHPTNLGCFQQGGEKYNAEDGRPPAIAGLQPHGHVPLSTSLRMNMSDQRQLLDMQRVKPPRVRTAFRGLNVKAETYHGAAMDGCISKIFKHQNPYHPY